MRLKIKANALVSVLRDVTQIVPSGTTRHTLRFVLLSAASDDRLDVFASGEMACVRKTVFALAGPKSLLEITEPGVCLLPARELMGIAKRAEGFIELETGHNGRTKISFGKVTYHLAGLPPNEFVSYEQEGDTAATITIPAGELRMLLQRTVPAALSAKKVEHRPILGEIHLVLDHGCLTVVETDSLILSRN